MADFDIKPASGTGNSLRLKNEAGNIVLSTNNGTGASSWGAVAPAGTIIQTKTYNHTPSTTDITTNSTTWVRVTAWDISITRTAGTHLVYMINGGGFGMDNNSQYFSATVMRSNDSFSSDLNNLGAGSSTTGEGCVYAECDNTDFRIPMSCSITDTASVTGAVKYGFFIRVQDSSFYTYLDGKRIGGGDEAHASYGIIAMEVMV
jgi:hypothetical protein